MRLPVVKLRVEPAERATWEAAAARDGQPSLSAFVKKACRKAASGTPYLTPEEVDAYHHAAEQLRRAGINLNTLLRELHALELGRHKEPIEPERFADVHGDLEAAVAEIRRLLNTKA
jgi:hypothetical protein